MSFHSGQFRELVKTTLQAVNLWSPAAEELLLGTCAQESHFGKYLKQIKGPALGVFQMEPRTEADIWKNYLAFRPERVKQVVFACGIDGVDQAALNANLRYQIVMARLHYKRVPAPLPEVDDLEAQAMYWDIYYNINPDKGFPHEYIENYKRFVRPL